MATDRDIHIVWLGSPVPSRVEALASRLGALHPGAGVRVWTDADLTWLGNHEEFVAEPRMSGKANIARYEILLRHGGIYLDADFRVHRPLDEVFRALDRFGLVVARQSRVLFNSAFIAAHAGHSALERAVAGITASRQRYPDASSPVRTGPHYFTSVLLDHVRSGGTFGELPQHAVYPWYADEAPLDSALVPESVIVSHEWATMHGPSFWDSDESATNRQREPMAKRGQRGMDVRARAASSPLTHEAIRRVERLRDRANPSTRLLSRSRNVESEDVPLRTEPLNPTTACDAIDAWTSRLVVRSLRGSDTFLDVVPESIDVFSTALRVLGRTGRAIGVTLENMRPRKQWRDPSVRCSAHLLSVEAASPDCIVRLESEGSTLLTREVTREDGLLGFTTANLDISLSRLVASIPRFALVRCAADFLTPALSGAIGKLLASTRIGELLLVVNPASTSPGVTAAVDLIRQQHDAGRRVTIGPWLIDGRGRAWDEHLRIAARPFAVRIR